MRTSALALAVLFVAVLTGGSPPAWAQQRYDDSPLAERFAVRLGGFLVQDFDTTVRFDSTQVPIGTVIDLEESLEVDSDTNVARIDGSYSFNKKHRISFGWFSVDRDGDTIVTEEIKIGDPETEEEIVIEPGARVLSSWDFDVINVLYNYSFLNTWRYELYIGGGFNMRDLNIDLVGDFDPGDGEVREEQFEAKGLLPLPVLAVGGRWNFSKKWQTNWRWQLFAIRIGDYRGTLQDTVGLFEHNTFKNVGFGFGLNTYNLTVEAKADTLKGEINESYVGLLGYVKVYF